MSWLAAGVVALLTGVLALVLGGLVMSACVGWYRISSFEGKSGYAVIAVALLSGVAGLALGLTAARLLPGELLRALALAAGLTLVLAGCAAALARALADVPPTLDGAELVLEVEVKLPAGAPAPPGPEACWLELGSVAGRVRRAYRRGALHPERARQEDGRWVVPGEAFLFTGRGRRAVSLQLGEARPFGFLLPLPARPGRACLDWSAWGPRPPAGSPPWPETEPSWRFRVVPRPRGGQAPAPA